MRFYTETTNSRGNKVSAGANKGQVAHISGWNSGVKVISTVDQDGNDRFDIYVTGSSNSPTAKKKIGYIVDGIFTESGE